MGEAQLLMEEAAAGFAEDRVALDFGEALA